jgi:hypothetical protein
MTDPAVLSPLITFAEAEAVGAALHDHFEKQLGTTPMARDDMGWGDVVQFVLRTASAAVRARDAGEIEGAPV